MDKTPEASHMTAGHELLPMLQNFTVKKVLSVVNLLQGHADTEGGEDDSA
ncbi:MAG: hypothetical protein AAFW87_06735 [Pseudomonadota bacterium]